jgi:hypothetical protein
LGTEEKRGTTFRRDGGTNFILRIKEQETCLTLQEHDDDDDETRFCALNWLIIKIILRCTVSKT